jgi:NAD-dependent DNA ligase
VIRFLASGQIKGIGEGLAGRMVEKFGPEVLEIMEKEPEKLLAVRGVGKKLLASIKESWADRREIRGLMLFLQNYDVPLTYAGRIFQLYGLGAVAKLKENPYELARSVPSAWRPGFCTPWPWSRTTDTCSCPGTCFWTGLPGCSVRRTGSSSNRD